MNTPTSKLEQYFKAVSKLSPGKFIKITNSDTDSFKLSFVVLSGYNNQWKKTPDNIYVPGLNVYGEVSILTNFFKDIVTNSDLLPTIFENSIKNNNIPTIVPIFTLNTNGELKETDSFSLIEFFD